MKNRHQRFVNCKTYEGDDVPVSFLEQINIAIAIEFFGYEWRENWDGTCRVIVGPEWFEILPHCADESLPLCYQFNKAVRNWAGSNLAFDVLQKMKEEGWNYILSGNQGKECVTFIKTIDGEDVVAYCEGHEQAMNICLAALKTRGIELVGTAPEEEL